MSDYTKSTNFAVKDGLTTGDPAKRIKGTEIDVEYNAIANAIASKADANNPTFTGTPVAPTAVAGTNTTQLATTAFVQAAKNTFLEAVYPVGSIYTNATNSTNPATLLGFGTWTAFGAGRVMVGFNASDPLFDTAEETGGSKDATVVSHTHTASTNSTGAHTHTQTTDGSDSDTHPNGGVYASGSNFSKATTTSTASTLSAGSHSHTVTVDSAGSSGTNANLQPYITVYMWKRTA